MTRPDTNAVAEPGTASGHTRSPFAGLDVCAQAGLPIRSGGRTVLFNDDLWSFTDVERLPVQMNRAIGRWDFTTISNHRWRQVAKEYLFARLVPRHEHVSVLPHAYRVPLTLTTCSKQLNELVRWLNWLNTQVTSLDQVSQDHCDRYLIERGIRYDRTGVKIGTLAPDAARSAAAVIIELAHYGELFTTDRYRQQFTPWNGRDASQVAGMGPPTQSKTPVLEQHVLAPMLTAALYVTTTLGPHVIELARQDQRRRAHEAALPSFTTTTSALAELLAAYEHDNRPLPATRDRTVATRLRSGWDPHDPLLRISLGALAAELGSRFVAPDMLTAARSLIEATAARVGVQKPAGRHAASVRRADGEATVAWTLPVDESDIRELGVYLNTAAYLVTATVTGMRSSELMELRAGCRTATHYGPEQVRYRITSTIIKGQPLGGTDDEWVVVREVDQALAMVEQLVHGDDPRALLFGRLPFNSRYDRFRAWVNGPAGQRLGLAPIPEGHVTLRMLRRTLAHELAYRPGGLLAAKIALKHVSVATTEGYANRPGGAQAKLLAEISDHEAERNLQLVADEYTNYRSGFMPAGPGARELTSFFATVDAALDTSVTPNVVPGDQHILNLLSKRAGVLHLATANYCWFTDPSRALCLKLAGTPTADKPLAGMCDSARCPQATHHPCHRPVWADTVATTTTFLGSLGRTRTTERVRLQSELDRAQRVLAAIDAAAAAPDPAGRHRAVGQEEQPSCG